MKIVPNPIVRHNNDVIASKILLLDVIEDYPIRSLSHTRCFILNCLGGKRYAKFHDCYLCPAESDPMLLAFIVKNPGSRTRLWAASQGFRCSAGGGSGVRKKYKKTETSTKLSTCSGEATEL
jgi:hypothetical protein